MRISFDARALRGTRWPQLAARFLLGGLVTVATGVIAEKAGPVVGGLFLAFPAIFPATVTLVARRERVKKARRGLRGEWRARQAVALEAAGTTLGAVSLVLFALLVWQGLPGHSAVLVLTAAAVLWLVVAILLWWGRKQQPAIRRASARLAAAGWDLKRR